jgi:hypothetical protein
VLLEVDRPVEDSLGDDEIEDDGDRCRRQAGQEPDP